ncbi:MAG: hypothetical protein WDW36_005391 [Sanguina aurantia]
MTGWGPEDTIGKNCRFLQGAGTERQKVMEIRDALREERSCQVCMTNYRKNGEKFLNQFYMCPIRNDAGNLIHYVGIQTDVTAMAHDSHQALLLQATLRNSPIGTDLAQLLDTVDEMPDVVAVEVSEALELMGVLCHEPEAAGSDRAEAGGAGGDGGCYCSTARLPCSLLGPLLDIQQSFVLMDPRLPDMPIIHASDKFLQLSGYPRNQVVGRNCRFLQCEGTDPAEVQKLRDAIHAEPPQPVTVTLLNRRANGELFWNALHVAPIRCGDGDVMFFIGVQLDVSQAAVPASQHQAPPSHSGMSIKMAHKGVTGAVRVAVRSLGSTEGLRRSIDNHGLPRSRSSLSSTSLTSSEATCVLEQLWAPSPHAVSHLSPARLPPSPAPSTSSSSAVAILTSSCGASVRWGGVGPAATGLRSGHLQPPLASLTAAGAAQHSSDVGEPSVDAILQPPPALPTAAAVAMPWPGKEADLEENLVDEHDDEHVHYSQRSPWLRAFVLGVNDGLVSVAALMLGVGGADASLQGMRLAGIAGWLACSLSMGLGEYVSVAAQTDSEIADIEKERAEQARGPAARAHELDELTQIYVQRGLSLGLAKQVAAEFTEKDVIRAHARDELGIDLDQMSNPIQAALVSMVACTLGSAAPLLAGSFIDDYVHRIICVVLVSAAAMALSGWLGAALGGARVWVGTLRCFIGGVLAMGATYGLGVGFGMLSNSQ